MTQVSVIMNCLNSADFLREAIDSVYAQTRAGWEIIFLDNASTDDSAAIARSYDSRLRYVRSPTTVPLGAARNAALAEARGEFVAFLDCDDIWEPEKLAGQIPCFDDPRVGLVYSDVLQFNRSGYGKPKYGSWAPPEGNVFDTMVRFENFLCMSTVVVRGAALRSLDHWFDESLAVTEDTDLWIRLCRDWHVAYAPGVLCRYRMHEKSLSYSAPNLFFEEEQRLLAKYAALFPEFEGTYLEDCRDRVLRDRAVTAWKKGDGPEARRLVRPLMFKAPRYFIAYCATLVPHHLVQQWRVRFSSRGIANYD